MNVSTFNDRFAAFLATVGLDPEHVTGLSYRAGQPYVQVHGEAGDERSFNLVRIETLTPTAKYSLVNTVEGRPRRL